MLPKKYSGIIFNSKDTNMTNKLILFIEGKKSWIINRVKDSRGLIICAKLFHVVYYFSNKKGKVLFMFTAWIESGVIKRIRKKPFK